MEIGTIIQNLQAAFDILQEKDEFFSDLYGDELHCVLNLVGEALKLLKPEPAPKHDGKLDEKGTYAVSYWQYYTIYIEETDDPLGESDFVRLLPAQALSLLTWLRQEESELQRLKKEQKEH